MKKIGFAGDVALSGIIKDFDEQMIFANLNLDSLSKDTVFVVNLEAPAIMATTRPVKTKGVLLNTTPGILKTFLDQNSIACVSLANNHIFDYGIEGVRTTISILEQCGIPFSGAGYLKTHLEPAWFRFENEDIAMLSYVHSATNPFLGENLYLNLYSSDEISDKIKELKSLTNNIIVSVHWGTDYSNYPESWQVADARRFIECGASMVVGHHAHTIQPFEKYKNGFIFYNLGSLIFGDFFLEGRLRALRINTKRSFIPIFGNSFDNPSFVTTRELRGNKLIVTKRDIKGWSSRKNKILSLKQKSLIVSSLVRFNEKIMMRILDIIYGYYRNPAKEIFRKGNMERLKKLFKKAAV